MISAAKRKTGAPASDDDSASQTIVARCGTKQRVFELPDKDSLRFDALKLADSHLAAFWDLAAVVEAHTFGDDFSLAKLSPDKTAKPKPSARNLSPKSNPENTTKPSPTTTAPTPNAQTTAPPAPYKATPAQFSPARKSDDATSIVILRPAPLPHDGRRISLDSVRIADADLICFQGEITFGQIYPAGIRGFD